MGKSAVDSVDFFIFEGYIIIIGETWAGVSTDMAYATKHIKFAS